MLRRLNDAMTQRVTRIQSWNRDKIDRGSKLRTNVIVDKYNKPSIAIVPEFFGTDYVTGRTNAMHTRTVVREAKSGELRTEFYYAVNVKRIIRSSNPAASVRTLRRNRSLINDHIHAIA